jgi:ABC-type dipeptide/oligopeptide/nickel transport system permease component
MGSCLIDSVMRRDYAVTQGCVLVYVLLFSFINLASDLLCLWLDPPIRTGRVPL